MGHGKETPRQKMIGMMYLVLTAMLALNVSKSVLDAFVLIDNGLMKTTLSFVAKNQMAYDVFESMMDQSPARVGPFRDKAHEVKRMSDQLTFDMQELKVIMVRVADGVNAKALTPMDWTVGLPPSVERRETFNVESILISAKDNKDIGGQVMIVEGRGEVLRHKVEEFRKFLTDLVADEGVKRSIEEILDTEPRTTGTGIVESWEIFNFNYLPMIAVITNLTKLQSDVRRAEADVVEYLLNQIGATDTRVNKLEAIVLTRSNFVLEGTEWTGRVVLAAYDSLQRPEIMLGQYRRNADNTDWEMIGDGIPLDYDTQGRATLRRVGSTVGTYPIYGLLRINTPDGYRHLPFDTEYQVGRPGATISATSMNVLYRDIDNPMSIGVSGVPAEGINANMTNGNLSRGTGGIWVARPGAGAESVINVTSIVDGQTRQMGQQLFRIRRVPDPVAKVGTSSGGLIPRAALASAQGIAADMGDFLFDLTFRVQRFTVIIPNPQGDFNETVNGFAFTQTVRDAIQRAPRGSRVFIENIRANNAQLGNRDLNTLVFTID